MKTLEQWIENLAGLQTDKADMEETFRGKKAELSRGVAGVREAESLAKLAGSNVVVALLPEEIKRVDSEIAEVEQAIIAALKSRVKAFNDLVARKAAEKRTEFLDVISPYFGGPEKAALTRREFAFIHIPAVAEIQHNFVELGDIRPASAQASVALAQHFIERELRVCKQFGWPYPVPEPAPARPMVPQKPAAPAKVRVRALTAMTGEGIGLINQKRPSPYGNQWRSIQPGEELTIPEPYYRANQRHFELLGTA